MIGCTIPGMQLRILVLWCPGFQNTIDQAHVIGAHSKSPYDPMVSIRPHLEALGKPLPAQPDLKPYARALNPDPTAHSKTLKFSLYVSTCTNPKASVSLTHSNLAL